MPLLVSDLLNMLLKSEQDEEVHVTLWDIYSEDKKPHCEVPATIVEHHIDKKGKRILRIGAISNVETK